METWDVDVNLGTQLIQFHNGSKVFCKRMKRDFAKRRVGFFDTAISTYCIDFSKVLFIKFIECKKED